MSNNLALWDSVSKTDPAHVKPITGKSYKGNSPRPHYLIHHATETFGPIGIGWGFEIVDDRLLEGAVVAPNVREQVHTAKVRVWYEWNGKRGTVEHVGQTMFSGIRRDGKTYTDEDAPKKSVTDALTKALSMIGFAGDIFMGRYDDSKYVSEITQEFREEERNGKNGARKSSAAAKRDGDWERFHHDLSDVQSAVGLERLRDDYRKNILPAWNKDWQSRFEEECEEKLAEFSQGKALAETLTDSQWLEKMQQATTKDELLQIGADIEAALPEEGVDRLLPAFKTKMKTLKAVHA